jgi:hypothetical protein
LDTVGTKGEEEEELEPDELDSLNEDVRLDVVCAKDSEEEETKLIPSDEDVGLGMIDEEYVEERRVIVSVVLANEADVAVVEEDVGELRIEIVDGEEERVDEEEELRLDELDVPVEDDTLESVDEVSPELVDDIWLEKVDAVSLEVIGKVPLDVVDEVSLDVVDVSPEVIDDVELDPNDDDKLEELLSISDAELRLVDEVLGVSELVKLAVTVELVEVGVSLEVEVELMDDDSVEDTVRSELAMLDSVLVDVVIKDEGDIMLSVKVELCVDVKVLVEVEL